MTETMWDRLSAPTPREEIKWREGPRGRQLAYVDARYVMDVLDRVCGPDGWQCRYDWSDGKRLVCTIGIREGVDNWIWKADGAGETDIEGEKGAFSDAFKRAAVRFGIARDLYHLQSQGPGRAVAGSPVLDVARMKDRFQGQKPAGSPTAPQPMPTPVQAPVRASEGNVGERTPVRADPPAAIYMISEVVEIHSKPDAPKKWVRWDIKTRDGKSFSTFDTKYADSARAAMECELPVKIATTTTEKGYVNMTALIVIEEHPEAPPVSPEAQAVADAFEEAEILLTPPTPPDEKPKSSRRRSP